MRIEPKPHPLHWVIMHWWSDHWHSDGQHHQMTSCRTDQWLIWPLRRSSTPWWLVTKDPCWAVSSNHQSTFLPLANNIQVFARKGCTLTGSSCVLWLKWHPVLSLILSDSKKNNHLKIGKVCHTMHGNSASILSRSLYFTPDTMQCTPCRMHCTSEQWHASAWLLGYSCAFVPRGGSRRPLEGGGC